MISSTVTIDSSMTAYLARPDGDGRYPGVILLGELFGVTESLRRTAALLASEGYVVVAPNVFHRFQAAAEFPRNEAGRARGFAAIGTLTRDGVIADVDAAMRYLADRPDVDGPAGIVGFSLGGHLAYLAATQLPLAATAVIYGGWLPTTDIGPSQPTPTIALTAGITGRLLFVAGDTDPHVPAEAQAAVAAALAAAEVLHEMLILPGVPHAYFFDDAETFDQHGHDITWQAIRDLLATTLKSSAPPAHLG